LAKGQRTLARGKIGRGGFRKDEIGRNRFFECKPKGEAIGEKQKVRRRGKSKNLDNGGRINSKEGHLTQLGDTGDAKDSKRTFLQKKSPPGGSARMVRKKSMRNWQKMVSREKLTASRGAARSGGGHPDVAKAREKEPSLERKQGRRAGGS